MSLRLEDVGHRYGATAAVIEAIDLEIGPDETVAIVGPSGSGKTTLLMIMGGLLRPADGEVTLDGRPLAESPKGDIAWVFQGINLVPHRSVIDNVRIGVRGLGLDEESTKERAAGALKALGLSDFAHKRSMHLSGGQAQRVGIARALAGRPRYVLADEPTGQLDQSTSREIVSLLLDQRPTGTSLVTATHDPVLASQCRKRYRLIDARLVAY